MEELDRTRAEQNLAAKAKDALDVAGEATLALLLHLIIQRWEGHVVQSQIKEERLAGDWLEVWRKRHQAGLLSNQGGVQTKRLQAAAERLQEAENPSFCCNNHSEMEERLKGVWSEPVLPCCLSPAAETAPRWPHRCLNTKVGVTHGPEPSTDATHWLLEADTLT